MMTIYGYLRVSTDKQDAESQKIGVVALAAKKGFEIDEFIIDEISGTKEPEKRLLGKVLKKIKKDDVIIASELSRLGRKLFMIMRILEHCMNCGAKVYTVKDGYELGDNIQSKVLAFAFGLSAEIERNLISQRTKEGLARLKSQGVKLGRNFGSQNKNYKLDEKHDLIVNLLEKGTSKRKIAKVCKTTTPTLLRFLNRVGLEKYITSKEIIGNIHQNPELLGEKK